MGKIGLSHIESSLASINSLDTDYLAEIIAATLIEEGVSPDNIQITRLGGSRMKVGKDIESVRMEYSPDDEINDCLRIYVNREGLYDVLPEGVFFLGIDLLESTDIKKVVNQVRQYRKEEMEIRKFFSVFEDEIDRTLVQMQLLERRVDRKMCIRIYECVHCLLAGHPKTFVGTSHLVYENRSHYPQDTWEPAQNYQSALFDTWITCHPVSCIES